MLFPPKKANRIAFEVEPSNRKFRLRLARYAYLAQSIRDDIDGEAMVLDIGCGRGRLGLYYEKHRSGLDSRVRIIGTDICVERLKKSRERHYTGLIHADLHSGLPFAGGIFDAVVCEQVLEHFEDARLAEILDEIVRVLKPGGVAYVGTPVFPRVVTWFLPLRERLLALAGPLARNRSTHMQHLTLADWSAHLRSHGLVTERTRGFRLFSLPRDWLEDYAWYYKLHRWLGRRVPGLCVEASLAGRKPSS